MIVQWLLASYSVTAVTYATWNPADKSTHITLSGWNLIATHDTNASWDAVRSTISKSSWKWYWEYTVTAWTSAMWGIGKVWATLLSYLGSDTNWYGYYTTGQKTNWWLSAYWASYAPWDIIGVAMDMDAWEITFYKNNVSQWLAWSWTTWTEFAMCSVINPWTPSEITANFGATAFVYTPPAWYNYWLYN